MSGRPCAHAHASGKPCGGFAVSCSEHCFAHDPARAAERDAARRRGGRAGRAATLPDSDVAVRSLADVVALVEATLNDVRAGRLDVKVANAVGYLANVAIRAIQQSELEAHLTALEAVLEPERQDTAARWRGVKR